MWLAGLWTRKSSLEENKPSLSSPVSEMNPSKMKSMLSRWRSYETANPETFETLNAPNESPNNERNHREHASLQQISSPRPLATSSSPPAFHGPSQEEGLPPTPTGISRSFPSVHNDRRASNLLSQYDPICAAALRAGTRGVTDSAEFQAPSFQVETNVGQVVGPVSSQHSPSVSSSNDIRVIERPERPQSRDVILAYNVELSDALFQQQSEEVSTMLRTAGVAQARRRRLRVATIRACRISEDAPITEFDLANLGAAFLAGLADDDDDDASVNNEVDTSLSASNEAGASSAVAPSAINSPSHQSSSESNVVAATSDVQATANPHRIDDPLESDEGDLSGLYSQFRDSWASPAPLIALFEEDDTFFSPLLRGEITGELSQIDEAIESERVEPEFSLAYLNVPVPAGLADDGGGERDRSPSAIDEVHPLSAVAPSPPNSLSHGITEVDLANLRAAFLAGAADDGEDDDASVNNEVDMSLSATDEARASSVAAPFALNFPSHQSSTESTVETAPSDVQTTAELPETNDLVESEGVDPIGPCSPCRDSLESSAPLISLPEDDPFFSPLLRGELDIAAFSGNGQPNPNSAGGEHVATESSSYNPMLQSTSIANADNRSQAGPAEIDARFIQRERDKSAEDEAQFSSSVALPQPTAVWHMEPAGIVIQLTPSSPRNSIESSQSNQIAQRRAMRRYNSHRKPTDHQASSSPATSDGPGCVGHQADRLTVPPFRKRRSRHRKTAEFSQPEDGVARPSSLHAETVPTSGYPGDSAKRCSPETPQIPVSPSRPAESGRRTINTGIELSAASETAPSSSAAPIRSPAVLRKKPKKVSNLSARLAPPPSSQKPRSLTSRITSSLPGWGTAALRLLPIRRSATVEASEVTNPSFDPCSTSGTFTRNRAW